MAWAAKQTGGRSYAGSNSVVPALNRIQAITSIVYTLSFVPPALSAQPLIHHLSIRVLRSGVKVLYRRSYLAPSRLSARDDSRQFVHDFGELAYNPLPLGSLTVAVKTGRLRRVDRTRYFEHEQAGPRRPGLLLPFSLISPFAPLVHRTANGRRFFDFSLLRLVVPMDGSLPPLLLPVYHEHGELAPGDSISGRAQVFEGDFVVPDGHPYLARLILRDNVDGKAGSVSFRLEAEPRKEQEKK